MTISRRTLDDAAAERLLRGRAVDGRPDLEAVAALVGALSRLEDTGPPAPRGELAALLSEGFDPQSPPAAASDVPVWRPAADAPTGLLRHPAARVAGLSLVAKVLLGSGVAVAGVTTAAGTGSLPDPVQDRVSTIVEAVTPFEVPRGQAPGPVVTVPATPDGQPPAEQPPAEPPRDRPVTPAPPPPGPATPPERPEPPRQGPPETRPAPAQPQPGQPAPERPEREDPRPAPPAEQVPDRTGAPAQERTDPAAPPAGTAPERDDQVEDSGPAPDRAPGAGPAGDELTPATAGPAAG